MWSQTVSSHSTSSSIVTRPTPTGEPSDWPYTQLLIGQFLSYRSYVSPLRNQSDQTEATLKIRVEGRSQRQPFEIPINKADSRFFKFPFHGR